MKSSVFVLFLCMLLQACGRAPQPDDGKPLVVVSIRPLALMVSDLAGDFVTVQSLLPANADPHNFALRVSDMNRLRTADTVVWLGPDLERSLGKAIGQVDAQVQLQLTRLDGITWPVQDEAPHPEHSDDDHHHEGHDHAEHQGRDPHIWLSPQNSLIMMNAVAERLIRLLPEQRQQIEAALRDQQARIAVFIAETDAQLAPLRHRGFAVHHDGYRHFVEAFDLRQLAAVSELPESRLSARHLSNLQTLLAGANCLLVDQVSPEVERLAATLRLPMVVADPLASQADTAHYLQFLQGLRQAFARCLDSPPGSA